MTGVVAATVGVMGQISHLLPGVESDTVALRFQARDSNRPPDLVVVGIDDVTFSDLDQQWPFPRRLHAQAIDRLRRAGARTIAYDVQFTEPTNARDDLALFNAVKRAGNVVLATTETDARGRTNVLGGEENLREAHAIAAASNLPTGPGGVFERFTRTALGIPSFAYATSRRSGGPALAPSDFEADGAWIDYRGGPGTIRTVSFSDLVRGRIDPAVFRGKIVVVGATSPSLQDVHATPAASDDLMSGPEIQANAIWTATRALPLRTAPALVRHPRDHRARDGAGVRRAARARRSRSRSSRRSSASFWLILAQLAFGAGWIVAVIWPLAALLMGTTGTIAARYLAELTERRRVDALQRGPRAPRPGAHRGAARDPARGRPPARAGGRVARRRHRRAHRAHEPPLRAPRAPDRAGASRTPSCSATRARCTTSARSASPTACS